MLFEKTYGIDLGSSSVKVYSFFRNKTYIEKNMIASKEHTIIAMGNEAYDMFEKSPTDITVTSPMTFGMIANLELQEIVLYSMIRKIDHILGFGATMYFTVPLDMTAVEKRAYFHVANGHWLKKNRVFMVEAPIADAIAMGVNLEDPEGNMIVNIGAQSTEVSIITGGKIIGTYVDGVFQNHAVNNPQRFGTSVNGSSSTHTNLGGSSKSARNILNGNSCRTTFQSATNVGQTVQLHIIGI